MLSTELVQGCLKGLLADPVGFVKLHTVIHYRRFVGGHAGQGLSIAQRVDQGVADPGQRASDKFPMVQIATHEHTQCPNIILEGPGRTS